MSNADVYGYKRNPKPAGVLSTEDSILVIGSADAASRAYLVQSWSMQYQQTVEELFELGSNRMFWKKNRPVGQGQLGRVCGAGTGSATSSGMFPSEALDACNGGASMAFKIAGGNCTQSDALTFKLSGVLLVNLGYSSQVQDAQVNEGVSWRFAHLQID